jgi:thymidylate synthase
MIHIAEFNAWDAYPVVLAQVLHRGKKRAARGLPTRDAGMMTISLESPEYAMLAGLRPSYGTRVAAAEAIQLIGGFHDPQLMLDASPRFAEYMEPEGHFHGAYGLRVGNQVYQAIRKMMADPDTRQAVVTLWNPMLDNKSNKRDYPCTVALRFELDAEMLNMDVLMRSNDAWLGLPYDLFQFTQLQYTVADAFQAIPGRYRHTAWSMHLYERDIEEAEYVASMNPYLLRPLQDSPIGIKAVGSHPDERFERAMKRARYLAGGNRLEAATFSEEWYRVRLAPRSANVG